MFNIDSNDRLLSCSIAWIDDAQMWVTIQNFYAIRMKIEYGSLPLQ